MFELDRYRLSLKRCSAHQFSNTLSPPNSRSQQEVEVHQPGGAGGPECVAHPQHPIRPHVAGRPLLHDVSRRHGGGPEGPDVSAAHPAAEEM